MSTDNPFVASGSSKLFCEKITVGGGLVTLEEKTGMLIRAGVAKRVLEMQYDFMTQRVQSFPIFVSD